MKQLVKNYTISSVAKTITLTDFTTVVPERLLLITDVTNQAALYQFNTTAGVTFATNVITFTSLGVTGNSDKLQIYYDTAAGDPVYDSGENQVKLTDGTNTANVVAGDTGFNGVATASATKTYTFTTSASGAQTILANTPTEGFSWIEVVYTSVGSGLALTGQFSTASGGAYSTSSSWGSSGANSSSSGIGSGAGTIYFSAVRGNYFQLAVSALTSGTFAGTVTLRAIPPPYNIMAITGTVGSNSAIGSAVPANAFYVGLRSNSGNLTGLSGADTTGDATAGSGILIGEDYIYNGTTFDRTRQATAASNTTGTGLLGVGNLGYDGTNYQLIGAPLQTTTTSNTAQGMMLVGAGVQSNTFSVTSVTAGTTYDVGNFGSVSVQITSQYVGTTPTIAWQASNDGTNWFSNSLLQSVPNTGEISSTTGTGIWFGGLKARYFRLNFTGVYSSGTAAGLIVFSTQPGTPRIQSGNLTVGSTSATGSAVPANAFYMGMLNGSGNLQGLSTQSNIGDANAGGGFAATGLNLWNGATYDRTRNNVTGAIIAAGATTAQTSTTQTTYNAGKLAVVINISAFTSGTLTFTVNGITSSGYTYPILVSTALGSTGVTALRVFPGATAAANTVANDLVPRSYNVVVSGTFSATYGIDYELSV